jgi:hypothetical protein
MDIVNRKYCFCYCYVIGGLKSRGPTKTHKVCTEKISPIEILTIRRLLMLRDAQKFPIAYPNYG